MADQPTHPDPNVEAARVVGKAWTMLDLVAIIEKEEARIGGRITSYLPAASK